MTLNLQDWTCFLASQNYPKQPCEMTADSHFILLQAQTSQQSLAEKYLKVPIPMHTMQNYFMQSNVQALTWIVWPVWINY